MELHSDERLGLVDHHRLTAGPHHTLSLTCHGFAHERLLVRPGYDRDVRPHTTAAEQSLHDAAIIHVREDIREVKLVVDLNTASQIITHGAADVVNRVGAVVRDYCFGAETFLGSVPSLLTPAARTLHGGPFFGDLEER